jgi:hypothetical protein
MHINKVSHVKTISLVAKDLGGNEDWLFDVANEMEVEDGVMWVYGVGEDGEMAFTDFGIVNASLRSFGVVWRSIVASNRAQDTPVFWSNTTTFDTKAGEFAHRPSDLPVHEMRSWGTIPSAIWPSNCRQRCDGRRLFEAKPDRR